MIDPYKASRDQLRGIGAAVRQVVKTLEESGVSVIPAEPPELYAENDDSQAEQ